MKQRSENDLTIFSSTILGIFGASLLLIPQRMFPLLAGFPFWAGNTIGLIFYLLALSLQVSLTIYRLRVNPNVLRFLTGLCLLSLAFLLFRAGLLLEGSTAFWIGFALLASRTVIARKLEKAGLINLLVIILEITAGGILLASSRSLIHIFFTILFFAAVGIGIFSFYVRDSNQRSRLSRLQSIPWALWCVFFFTQHAISVILPALTALLILFRDLLQWERLVLPEKDILAHRVVMIGSTINLTMLIFLSALLYSTDHAVYASMLLSTREAAFLFFILISAVIYYQVSTIIMAVNGLMLDLTGTDEGPNSEYQHYLTTWTDRLNRYIRPFMSTREGERIRMNAQADQIEKLSSQLRVEKKRNIQLTLLHELSQQLENQLDEPVSAQLAVNTLERALGCSLVSLYVHEPDQKEFMLLAASGYQTSLIPSGYRQNVNEGAIGRAMRQRKTQIINDIRLDSEYILFEKETNLSCVIIPMISNGHVNGMLVLNSEKTNAFSSIDIGMAEAVASELTRAWERSGYHLRLMELIRAGSHLSTMVEPETTAREVAAITRKILNARFTFVKIKLGQEDGYVQIGSSGKAPDLLASLLNDAQTDTLIQAAFNAGNPFRVRDVRKYASASKLEIGNSILRSMLAIPIRWNNLNIGAILAFGKQNEVFFSENDESLAELLATQAAGAFESTWLQQEVRSSLRTTSLLYRLSTQVIQAETIQDAAEYIAQTAHKLAKGTSTGIMLFSQDGKIEAEMEIDTEGNSTGSSHPVDMILQVMESGQSIYMSMGHSMMRIYLPIQTPIHKYGAIWINVPEDQKQKPANPADLQTLVNQSAIALERSLLLVESRRQAREIKIAYDMLEETYDQTLAALSSALDARDRETEGHSIRVSHLTKKLGEALGFTPEQLKVLERGSLLHDIGKIGISDSILHKPGPLNEDEWKIMRLHPDIGAHIVEKIPFLEDTIPLIRHHQERWNGTGYPGALKEEEIPILARMFAIVDAFDALTSNRPYRTKISTGEAVDYLAEQAGILFDPHIVEVFKKMILEGGEDIDP